MAKKTPPAEPQSWIVTLNGHDGSWETTATTEAEAVASVIKENGLLRDERNFKAVPALKPAELSAPIPKIG